MGAPGHPDPDRFHLQTLVSIIGKLKRYGQFFGMEDVAIAIDFCTLWQDTGNRTEHQTADFHEGLSVFNDLYIHQHVTAIILRCMPDGTMRLYDERGWTLCESSLIYAKAGLYNRLDFDKTVANEEGYMFLRAAQACAKPPMLPEEFDEQLKKRRQRMEERGMSLFTNGKDTGIVPKIYRESFECVRLAKHLSYAGMAWGDTEVHKLCKVLRVSQTRFLALGANRLRSGAALSELCEVLCEVGVLQNLALMNNDIDEQAFATLEHLVSRLPSLSYLSLHGNPFCQNKDLQSRLKATWVDAGKEPTFLNL